MSVTSPRPRAVPFPGLAELVGQIAPGAGAVRGRPGRLAPLVAVAAACVVAALLISHGGSFAAALERALHANWALVIAGGLLEIASVAGYVLLLHRVVSGASPDLRWQDSYDISLAGTAATRLLPTAGLGGAAVTVWALRARGVRPAELAERLVAFLVLLYSVYMLALVAAGATVAVGLVHVAHGRGLGLVAALAGGTVIALVLLVLAAPGVLARALQRIARRGSGRWATLALRAHAGLPVLRTALTRSAGELRHPHPALLGAGAWWGFDIAVLYSMLHAFGASPHVVVLVLAYFLGTTCNVLPLPGSLSGGLTGTLIALGTPAAPALAAVLAYRTMAVWLPAGSGLLSVARLRVSVAGWRREALAGADIRP
ncbi:MAG: lysylphosphatidylglycerol synthase domain-containing protein [Solirubrobacteraceae bacterium]